MRTIGVEEEFLLVAADGSPRAVASAVLQHASAQDGQDDEAQPGGALEKEFAQEQIETSTHPCTELDALLTEVRAGRRRAETSARHAGAHVAALATPPQAGNPTVIANARARAIRSVFGQTARDQLTCGCHVHVGVDDDEQGIRVVDHLRAWTPVLLALSANSPYWQGVDTEYESYRSQVWGRWPTAGPTAPFGDAATYRQVVDDLVATGTILDTGMVYFDARLSAHYPTVEVRVPDVCLDPADAVLQAALVRGLADTALTDGQDGPAPRAELIRIGAWRAARSGLTADLVSPVQGRPRPAGEVVEELIEHVRPALERSGDLAWVRDQVAEIGRRGNGAQQQRAWRHDGADDQALVAQAVERTLS